MRIFVNDKPLDILASKQLNSDQPFHKTVVDHEDLPPAKHWKGDVLFLEPSEDQVIRILYVLRTRKLRKLNSVTLVSKQKKDLKSFIKSRFQIIKAAGGIVQKDNKFLLIFRLGKWDFPKGKFEKGETPIECAVREVEEECAVEVKAEDTICKTWHTYTRNRKSILKKTYWYTMSCINDKDMKPQKEEGIDDIKWMKKGQVKSALKDSYPSMRYLFKKNCEKLDQSS